MNILRINHPLIFLLTLLLFLTGCLTAPDKDIPDVSDIEVDLDLRRFEKDLFQLDTAKVEAGLRDLRERYPEFGPIYLDQILGASRAPVSEAQYVKGFITFPEIRKLYDTCMLMYDDLDFLVADLEQALRYFRYHFPEQPLPDLTTYISEYSLGGFIYGENRLALGLDFYLGSEYPYARFNPGNSNFSAYLTRSFTREYMVRKAIKPLVNDLVGEAQGGRMLDYMVNAGKKLYLTEQLLPRAADSILLEYTATQVQWLDENEIQIWAYLLQENLIYESEWLKIRKFVEYAPSIPQMHPEAPGRAANWIGWQIIKAYMDRHPETTLPQLLAIQDPQLILDQSRYKPRRR